MAVAGKTVELAAKPAEVEAGTEVREEVVETRGQVWYVKLMTDPCFVPLM